MPYTAYMCNNCNDNILVNINASNMPDFICPECVREYYSCCERCTEYFRDSDLCEGLCEDCVPETCSECGDEVDDGGMCSNCQTGLKPHDYTRPDEHWTRMQLPDEEESIPHYGLELELYWRSSDRPTQRIQLENLMSELTPNDAEEWVAKTDGSLNDNGCELESLPYSKNAIQASLKIISQYTDHFKGYQGYNNGLHVNLDRPKNNHHIYRVLKWMNDPLHKGFIEHIGQRELNIYCQQIEANSSTLDIDNYKLDYLGLPQQKYSPVKIGTSRLEFRIFKANMLPHRINKAIDFCQAVVDYCEADTEDHEPLIGVDPFIQFVFIRKSQYPDFYKYLLLEYQTETSLDSIVGAFNETATIGVDA